MFKRLAAAFMNRHVHTVTYTGTVREMTPAEIERVNAAFEKMNEAFAEMNEAMRGDHQQTKG